MTAPDIGAWFYEYDPIGTLAAQVDAREQRIEYSWSSAGRTTIC